MRSQRASKHYEALLAGLHDTAVDTDVPAPATPQPLPPLLPVPALEVSPPAAADPSPPALAPGPPKNRRLEFGAQASLPAAAEAAQEPSLTPAADPPSPPEFDAQANLPAAAEPAQLEGPSPRVADCSALPPGSPRINCSQYRQAQHDEERTAAGEGDGPPPDSPQVQGSQPGIAWDAERNGPSFLRDKVDDWRQHCALPEGSEAPPAPPDRYPTPPNAPYDEGLSDYSDSLCEGGRRYTANYKPPQPSSRPKSRPGPIMVRQRDQVWVRKDHRDPRGLAPLCYVATGYNSDGPPDADDEHHRAYLCYDRRDLEWAHRLKFHLNRFC